jgi:adenylate cyclase
MPFRQTIAAKIFGLAIILLLLTVALAGFLLYEVTRTTQDLTVVANFDVPLTQSLARLRGRYDAARRNYLAQDWDTAEATFRECLKIRPNDGPSHVFLECVQALHRNPPGKDWNGVWQLVEK